MGKYAERIEAIKEKDSGFRNIGSPKECARESHIHTQGEAVDIASEADAEISRLREALEELVQEFPYPASEHEMDAYNKARQALKGETHD